MNFFGLHRTALPEKNKKRKSDIYVGKCYLTKQQFLKQDQDVLKILKSLNLELKLTQTYQPTPISNCGNCCWFFCNNCGLLRIYEL